MSNASSALTLSRTGRSSDLAPADPAEHAVERAGAGVPSERPTQAVATARPAQLSNVQVRARERARRRLPLKSILFVLVVLIPTLLAGIYYLVIASDQYVSESRFGIRSAENPRSEVSAILSSVSATQIGLESNVVVQYMQSREVVDALQQRLGLRALFERSDVDALSRLQPGASAEDVVKYWRHKADPFFDPTTGTISLRVKAFTAADAYKLNAAMLLLAENLVNEISRRAREDAARHAQDSVNRAEDRLRKVRQDILAFRNSAEMIEPKEQAKGELLLIAKLREQLAQAKAEQSSNSYYLNKNAPTLVSLRNRIRGLEEQIASAEAQLTSSRGAPNDKAYSRAMGDYEALEAERQLAEKSYGAALEMLQRAQEHAARQSIYFSVFVQPGMPEQALYPRRLENIALVLIGGIGAWIMLLLAMHSIRDHV